MNPADIANLFSSSLFWIIFSVCITGVAIVGSLAITIFVIRYIRGNFGSGEVKNGVTAMAQITRLWDTGTTINDDPLAGLELRVTPPNGAPFITECKQVINRLQVGAFQPGAMVTVSYDPANPKKIHITGVGAAAPAAAYGGAPEMPAAGYSTPVGMPGMPQMNPAQIEAQLRQIDAANQALIATGQPAPAQVLNYMDWNVHVNGENPAVTLQLQVNPPGKPSFMAQTTCVIAASSIPKYQPGCTIWVKYDPNNLTRVTVDHS